MSEFSVSVENLLGLAQTQEQQHQPARALAYYAQAYELDDGAAVTERYLQAAIAADKFSLAQELLRTDQLVSALITSQRLTDYCQWLWQAHVYLLLDQAPQLFAAEGYQLTATEEAAIPAWTAKIAQVKISPAQLDQCRQLVQKELLTPVADHQTKLAPLLNLTPAAYLTVVMPILQNSLLTPFLRMLLLNNLMHLSQPVTVSLYWRGQLQTLNSADLLPVDQLPVYQELTRHFADQLDSGQLVYSDLKFVQSNLVTYLLLTYPFCEKELRPITDWQQFLASGQIDATLSSMAQAQLRFWQEQERQFMLAAGQ